MRQRYYSEAKMGQMYYAKTRLRRSHDFSIELFQSEVTDHFMYCVLKSYREEDTRGFSVKRFTRIYLTRSSRG